MKERAVIYLAMRIARGAGELYSCSIAFRAFSSLTQEPIVALFISIVLLALSIATTKLKQEDWRSDWQRVTALVGLWAMLLAAEAVCAFSLAGTVRLNLSHAIGCAISGPLAYALFFGGTLAVEILLRCILPHRKISRRRRHPMTP